MEIRQLVLFVLVLIALGGCSSLSGLVASKQGEIQAELQKETTDVATSAVNLSATRGCQRLVAEALALRRDYQFAAAKEKLNTCLAHVSAYAPALRNLGILEEIYLGNPLLALNAYEALQQSLPTPDREVARWVKSLVGQLAEHSEDAATLTAEYAP